MNDEVLDAQIRRYLRQHSMGPLGELLFEPALDDRQTKESLYCPHCEGSYPFNILPLACVEPGVVCCSNCGAGQDEGGTFSRAVFDYGRRMEQRA